MKFANLINPKITYEVFYFANNTYSVWRTFTSTSLYPQELIKKTWVSDYGFGDYELHKNFAISCQRFTALNGLEDEQVKTKILSASKVVDTQRFTTKFTMLAIPIYLHIAVKNFFRKFL